MIDYIFNFLYIYTQTYIRVYMCICICVYTCLCVCVYTYKHYLNVGNITRVKHSGQILCIFEYYKYVYLALRLLVEN